MLIKMLTISGLALWAASGVVGAEEMPVVSVVSKTVQITEGQQMTWDFKLTKPAPADNLVVTVNLTEDTDPTPGDVKYNVPGSKGIAKFELTHKPDGTIQAAQVTLVGGVTEAVMMSEVIADGKAEGPESATWTLVDGKGYKADMKQNKIMFTLIDP